MRSDGATEAGRGVEGIVEEHAGHSLGCSWRLLQPLSKTTQFTYFEDRHFICLSGRDGGSATSGVEKGAQVASERMCLLLRCHPLLPSRAPPLRNRPAGSRPGLVSLPLRTARILGGWAEQPRGRVGAGPDAHGRWVSPSLHSGARTS